MTVEKIDRCVHLAWLYWQEAETPNNDTRERVYYALARQDEAELTKILEENGIDPETESE